MEHVHVDAVRQSRDLDEARERGLRLDTLARRLSAHRPDRRLAELGQRLAFLRKSLDRQQAARLQSARDRLANLARTLHAVSPLETIGRGYSVITAPDGEVISQVAQVEKGDRVSAQLSDGFLDLSVDKIRKP